MNPQPLRSPQLFELRSYVLLLLICKFGKHLQIGVIGYLSDAISHSILHRVDGASAPKDRGHLVFEFLLPGAD